MSTSVAPARFVVAVGSGKGGVGKSTLTLNVALALAESGAQVGVLDADLYGPDIPLMVNIKREESVRFWDLARADKPLEIEPADAFGLKIMSAGFILGERDPLTMESSLVSLVLNQFLTQVRWGALDYLLVDLPPGTADLQQRISATFSLAGAIVVVTPQDVAHLDGRKAIEMFRRGGVRILGGVENMDGLVCPHCKDHIELFPRVRDDRSIWSLGVARLGGIPMDPAVASGGDRGHPIMREHPDSATAWAFRRIESELRSALGA